MNYINCGLVAVSALFFTATASAQNTPIKVNINSVLGAKASPRGVAVAESMRDAKLHVELQNIGSKETGEILVEWTYVVEYVYVGSGAANTKTYTDGSKKVELKAAEKKVFDTDSIEVSRRDRGPSVWRGYWVKVTHDGKTLFEDFSPQTIKKSMEQRQKELEKETK